MTFSQAIQSCFQKYVVFDGRARRSEFWYFSLFTTLVSTLLLFILPGLNFIFSLAVFLPSLAVTWRRLHDTGRSGAWYFLSFIPLVGGIILLIWLTEDSQAGANMYGYSPKSGNAALKAAYQPAAISAPASQTRLAVLCLAGPMKGQTYPLTAQGMTLGRDTGCNIRLPDGLAGVSRQHCMIQFQQGNPVLIDLNSTYGTFLADGKRLPPQYPEYICVGTRFYLGTPTNLFQLISG